MPDAFVNPWGEGGVYWNDNAVQHNALNYGEEGLDGNNPNTRELPRSVEDVTIDWLPGDVLEYLRRLIDFDSQDNPIRKLERLIEGIRAIPVPVIPGEDVTKAQWSALLGAWFLETTPPLHEATWIGDTVEFGDKSLYCLDIMESVSYGKIKESFFKVADADRPNPFLASFSFTGPETAIENYYSAVEWFIGSYDANIQWNINTQTGEYRVVMMITNVSHWYSGTRLPGTYQKIIEERFGIQLTNFIDSAPRGQTIRRKMPARLLAILDHYGIEVPSVGGNMLQRYDISDVWTTP